MVATPAATPAALDAAAWAQQYREPLQAAALGQQLAAAAGGLNAWAACGHFHTAWAHWRVGQAVAAQAATAELQQAAGAAGDAASLALARDVQALVLRREHRWADSLALLQANLALPEAARPPQAHCLSNTGAALCLAALQRHEEALRCFHQALAQARRSGDAAWVANAAGNLGGAHYDLCNPDDAHTHLSEALQAAEAAGAALAWATAAINLTMVHCDLGQADAALALMTRLRQRDADLPAAKRAKYATVYADVTRRQGQLAQAQAWLDEAAAGRQAGEPPSNEWAAVQAQLWLQAGRAERALALLQAQLALAAAPNLDDTLYTVHTLQALAAEASEGLQRWQQALQWRRLAEHTREALAGRAAQARRVALELSFELALARQQRDAAQAEQGRLAELNTQLQAAQHAKAAFIAAASHDLRQPVHALALQVAALQAQLGTATQQAMAERMERSVAALTDLFNALLDLSRIDAGVVVPEPRALALGPLLATLVEQHQADAQARGLALRLRLAHHGAAARVWADPVLLQRVLRNLLVNALHHTPHGSVLLTLRRRGGRWRVAVRDSGPGIEPVWQERVFEEFVQMPRPVGARDDGLGLGLAIVKRLAGLMQLGLSLRSAPGRGSCFALDLPLAPGQPEAAAEAPASAPGRALAGCCVLVVDDDAGVREALADLLRSWGCEPALCDGREPLALACGWVPDAAVLDYRLGGAHDGLAWAAALRQRFGPGLPCLLTSGDTAPAALQRFQASGLPWSAKPMSPQRLHQWLAMGYASKAHP